MDGGREEVRSAALAVARRRAQRNPWLAGQVDDVVQETLLRYEEALGRGPVEHPAAWGRQVAGRVIADLYRAEPDDPSAGLDPSADPMRHRRQFGQQELFDFLRGTGVLSTSHQAVLRRLVEQVRGMLTEREAELLVRRASGQSDAEIATAMGYASAGTVKATAHRAKARVLAALDGAETADAWIGHERPY